MSFDIEKLNINKDNCEGHKALWVNCLTELWSIDLRDLSKRKLTSFSEGNSPTHKIMLLYF